MKNAIKWFLVFFAVLVPVSTIFCVDWSRGPRSVSPGDLLLNGAFDVGFVSYSDTWGDDSRIGFGGTLAVDCALPKFALTLGGETGFTGNSDDFGLYGVTPVMLRLGYHPDFGVEKLNIYGLAKGGVAFAQGFDVDDDDGGIGFGFGLNLGARYFFTERLAVFAELGFDYYHVNAAGDHDDRWVPDLYTATVSGAKIATLGLTYKFIPSRLFRGGRAALPPAPKYTLAIDGQHYGPYGMKQLRHAARQGSLTPDTLVRKEGVTQWETAGTVGDLTRLFGR